MAVLGAEIPFTLEEIGISGPAKVVAIEACPIIESGPGRVVVATVQSESVAVLNLKLKDVDATLCPTIGHPFFSETRKAWVRAGELKPGELLKTAHGTAEVLQIERIAGLHKVYNLEVEAEHCYYVGESLVLSHNVDLNPKQNLPQPVPCTPPNGAHPANAPPPTASATPPPPAQPVPAGLVNNSTPVTAVFHNLTGDQLVLATTDAINARFGPGTVTQTGQKVSGSTARGTIRGDFDIVTTKFAIETKGGSNIQGVVKQAERTRLLATQHSKSYVLFLPSALPKSAARAAKTGVHCI